MIDLSPILRRTVISFAAGRTRLAGGTQISGGGARIYAHWPTGDAPQIVAAEGAASIATMRHIPHGTILTLAAGAGPVRLRIDGAETTLKPDPDETEVFAGRNTLMIMRNGEDAGHLATSLRWHARHHGADAALIIDRSAPGGADALAADLGARMATDPALAGMRVMIVDFDWPLGLDGRGAESHPIHAPDAPGKDRMARPAPDPWAAPLGFYLVYDLMRERWLNRARAVASVEAMDLLDPPQDGETGVFDAVQDAAMGLLPTSGRRAFPWGIGGTRADFGDHICTRFDANDRDQRYVVAPHLLPADVIWMLVRVLGAKTTAPGRGFWRFMGLRHGQDGRVAQIVPKTSLVEDPALLALAETLGHDPQRVPEDDRNADDMLPARAVKGRRTAIVTTMKNEGPFIMEWLAYHRAIGVSDFLVYTNDCTDGTDGFFDLLQAKGLVQHRENPYRQSQMKPQHAALDAANTEPVIRRADWVICMDVDEYIAVHTGDGTLGALFDAVPDANMIALTWRLFGNDDVDQFRDDFITQQFFHAAREFCNKPHQAWGFKTLFKNVGLFRKLGVHRPKGLRPQAVGRVNWVNGSGRQLPPDQWRNAWRSHAGTYGYDLVSLNHYAVRSAESFLVKRDRGRVNHVDRDQGLAYWFRMNHNVMRDDRMRRVLPMVRAEYDRLMADRDIAAAHAACVAAHRARIAELKARPDYATFHAQLTSERMRRLSRLHGHFGSAVYLAGPDVIPDEVVNRDPDSEFFFTVHHDGETRH